MPIEKPVTLRVGAVDGLPLGAMRDSCDLGGVSDGLRLAIYLTLYNECPLGVARVLCVSAIHLYLFIFYFIGSLRVSASYLSFLAFVFSCFCYFSSLFLSSSTCFLCFLFAFMLSLELCRYSTDLSLPSRPRTGLATEYITGFDWGPIG